MAEEQSETTSISTSQHEEVHFEEGEEENIQEASVDKEVSEKSEKIEETDNQSATIKLDSEPSMSHGESRVTFLELEGEHDSNSDESDDEKDKADKKKKKKGKTKKKQEMIPKEKVGAEFTPLGPVVSSLLGGGSMEDEEEEEEKLEEKIEEVFEPIDREAYIEEYKNLIQQQLQIKRKNAFLQFKLILFYKKRKMDHVFKENEIDDVAIERYNRRLDDLGNFRERGHREQSAELADLQYMGELVKEQTEQSAKDFKSMQLRERETARGLMDTRTGKPISDKQVERLIARQSYKSKEIATIRLNYIKKKEQVKSLEQHIRTLETIDGKHHLTS